MTDKAFIIDEVLQYYQLRDDANLIKILNKLTITDIMYLRDVLLYK